jgi:hypothetical protein
MIRNSRKKTGKKRLIDPQKIKTVSSREKTEEDNGESVVKYCGTLLYFRIDKRISKLYNPTNPVGKWRKCKNGIRY